jgi:signal peptidase II
VKLRWLLLCSVLGAGVALDQGSKHWAEGYLRPRGILTLVSGVLDLRYVRNPGAFFSLGANLELGPRRILLVGASVVVLGLILSLYRRASEPQRRLRLALALVASGAIGNLIDRIRYGEVTDFVHFQVGPLFQWATFNLADVWITAGLLLLALDLIRPEARAPRAGVGRLSQPTPTDGGY